MKIPNKFDELREYQARIKKGIMHFAEYHLKMMRLRDEFAEWKKQNPIHNIREGRYKK